MELLSGLNNIIHVNCLAHCKGSEIFLILICKEISCCVEMGWREHLLLCNSPARFWAESRTQEYGGEWEPAILLFSSGGKNPQLLKMWVCSPPPGPCCGRQLYPLGLMPFSTLGDLGWLPSSVACELLQRGPLWSCVSVFPGANRGLTVPVTPDHCTHLTPHSCSVTAFVIKNLNYKYIMHTNKHT